MFTGTGIAAAFGAAACCALPILLASAGLGTAWIASIGAVTGPYRTILLGIAAMALAAGALLLWRQQRAARTCTAGTVCAPPATRLATGIGIIVGMALLVAAFIYG